MGSKNKSLYEYLRFTVLNVSWLKIYIYIKSNPWTWLNLCIFHFPSVWRVSFNLFLVMNLQNKEGENMQCEAIFFLLRPPRSKKGWWEVTDCVGVGWAGQGGWGPWGHISYWHRLSHIRTHQRQRQKKTWITPIIGEESLTSSHIRNNFNHSHFAFFDSKLQTLYFFSCPVIMIFIISLGAATCWGATVDRELGERWQKLIWLRPKLPPQDK